MKTALVALSFLSAGGADEGSAAKNAKSSAGIFDRLASLQALLFNSGGLYFIFQNMNYSSFFS
jgi:hypothetical protein